MLLHRPFKGAAAILIVCLFGTNVSFVAAQNQTPGLSQLGGWVYIDKNNDGDLAFMDEPNPEYVIGGVTISLYLQGGPQDVLVKTTQSDDFGRFFFNDIAPGTYGLKQTQPIQFVDGQDTVGRITSLNNGSVPPGSSIGTAGENEFNGIKLTADARGDFYFFGELGLAPGYVSKRYLLGSAPELHFASVPEPATATLTLGAMCLLFGGRRRR
jgi:hypothetical protein